MKSNHTPDFNRVSVLTATILLAYVVARLVDLPEQLLDWQILGLYISFNFNIHTVIAVILAGLTATGADWLLRGHPLLGDKSTVQHWILPALTAWVISVPLSSLPLNPIWWTLYAIGGGLLLIVLVAEYIAVDPEDVRYPIASACLIAVSFALFLILAVTLKSTGARLIVILVVLTISITLISLRTFSLRSPERFPIRDSWVVAILTAQIMSALHYLPLSATSFGLAILGPAYALTALISVGRNKPLHWQRFLEPAVVLVASWGAAFWLR